ncbi:uncharacterized protein LOC107264105 [Cephus cinctus]|uniref:Uncharacterized protein LOC107264105 n=1 Tax=Cephus cinctus TaxID=211228 RepID=A0AAJ7BJB6_CEPCN|nr:uncharacterized protein LOC107264105 [Cephus cinctus]
MSRSSLLSVACYSGDNRVSKNLSLKSLPILVTCDSRDNVQRILRYGTSPRRRLLQSFIKAHSLEVRPKRRLCHTENEYKGSGSQTNSELNVRKLRQELAKEKNTRNGHDTRKSYETRKNPFGHHDTDGNITDIFCPRLFGEQNDSLNENFLPNLHPLSRALNISSKSLDLVPRNPSVGLIDFQEKIESVKLNILHPVEKGNIESLENQQEILEQPSESEKEKSKDEVQINLMNLEKAKEPKKIDFSRGDDSCLNEELLPDENPCRSDAAQYKYTVELEAAKRSVQWSNEVDVIYYAGDANGGKVIRRKTEPLREEADQQARHKHFINMALTRSLLSGMNARGRLINPRIALFHK